MRLENYFKIVIIVFVIAMISAIILEVYDTANNSNDNIKIDIRISLEQTTFNTLEDFEIWINENTPINHEYEINGYDCEDYALEIQRKALNDGYIINVAIDDNRNHAYNTVFIPNENKVYSYDYLKGGEIKLIGYLDSVLGE